MCSRWSSLSAGWLCCVLTAVAMVCAQDSDNNASPSTPDSRRPKKPASSSEDSAERSTPSESQSKADTADGDSTSAAIADPVAAAKIMELKEEAKRQKLLHRELLKDNRRLREKYNQFLQEVRVMLLPCIKFRSLLQVFVIQAGNGLLPLLWQRPEGGGVPHLPMSALHFHGRSVHLHRSTSVCHMDFFFAGMSVATIGRSVQL